MKRATAFSPASIGNVAVGFDILGHSVAGAGDRVTVTRTESGTVKIVAFRGAAIPLPLTASSRAPGPVMVRESETVSVPSWGASVMVPVKPGAKLTMFTPGV